MTWRACAPGARSNEERGAERKSPASLSIWRGFAMAEFKVLLDNLAFPEGPRWHDGKLYLSDMHAHQVLAVTMDGTATVVAEVPAWPSGLGWLPDGRLL